MRVSFKSSMSFKYSSLQYSLLMAVKWGNIHFSTLYNGPGFVLLIYLAGGMAFSSISSGDDLCILNMGYSVRSSALYTGWCFRIQMNPVIFSLSWAVIRFIFSKSTIFSLTIFVTFFLCVSGSHDTGDRQE